MHPQELAHYIHSTIREKTKNATTITQYREPLVRWVQANNTQFEGLKTLVHPDLMSPQDMLPGAKSVVAFFLPFEKSVVNAHAENSDIVAVEWAQAYVDTNKLLKHITDTLICDLGDLGIRAAAALPTHNFDPKTLRSNWSHKSIAVISGLGSFGLHRMVITDAGCAGRFSSLILDAELPETALSKTERCLHYTHNSCQVCVQCCPVGALKADGNLDKNLCWQRCLTNGERFRDIGLADVCGKCATGPCASQNPVTG